MENPSKSTTHQREQKPKISSQGNLVKHSGDKTSVSGDDGIELANWTVTGINLSPQCTEPYQAPVKNGHLVALDVQVNTTPLIAWKHIRPLSHRFREPMKIHQQGWKLVELGFIE